MKPFLRLCIHSLLFLSPSFVNAQANDLTDSQKLNEESYVTFNLLSSLNSLNPRWRVGYVKSINPKWKVGVDLGYGNRGMSLSDFGGKIGADYQLWEIRPELYYIVNPKRKTVKYFSAELFYIHHKDLYQEDYFYPERGGSFMYESANYRRQKYGMHLKYGFFINSGNKLGLNIYTGLGFRYRNNSFSNILQPVPVEERGYLFVSDYNEYEGLDFNLNFTLGFKLTYKLHQ